MSQFFILSACSALAFLISALWVDTAQAQKSMVCRLQSEKVVQGKERQCLYKCADGSIEGRTRRVNQECLKTVYSES